MASNSVTQYGVDTIVKHDKSDMLYVDKDHRRCIDGISERCVNKSPEGYGHLSKFEKGRHGGYKPLCNACLYAREKERNLTKAQSDIAALVSRATRKPLVGEYAPPIGAYAKEMFDRLGGPKKVAQMSAEACETILVGGARPKDKLDTIRVLHDLLLKAQEPEAPIDMSQIDEDDLVALLSKYAADLLKTDKEFIKNLLNDPAIRKAVLDEVGVTVLEAQESEFEE